jgi:Protein of unknown function (DUF2953)
MFWLLVVAGLLLATVGLLRAPVDVSLALVRDTRTDLHVGVRWLFLRFERKLGEGGRAARKPKAEKKPGKPHKGGIRRLRTLRSVASVSGLTFWLTRFLGRLVGAVRVRRLAADLRLGLEDPADTGRLFGFLAPLALGLDRFRRLDVRVLPDFGGPVVAGRAEAVLTLYPFRVAAALLLLVFSPQAFRLAWALARSR